MIAKVISGGQTGADQAGLAAAFYLGIPTGGTVPQDFWTQDGSMPWLAIYGVREDYGRDYRHRTHQNVESANLTIWFGRPNTPGYYCTKQRVDALRVSRRWLLNPTEATLRLLIHEPEPLIINIAGNRESKFPGLYRRTYNQLCAAWAELL